MQHSRELVTTTEWELDYTVSAEPIAVIRRLTLEGATVFYAVTGAPETADCELIGNFGDLDAAAVAAWRRYCDAERHDHARCEYAVAVWSLPDAVHVPGATTSRSSSAGPAATIPRGCHCPMKDTGREVPSAVPPLFSTATAQTCGPPSAPVSLMARTEAAVE